MHVEAGMEAADREACEIRAMIQSIRHARARFASRCRSGAVKDHATTLAMFLGASALAFMPLFLLLWLTQPTVLANPGTTVRTVPRIVYAEPPPADPDLPQTAETPGRDVPAQLRQAAAQLRQASSGEQQARAYERKARARPPKAQAALAPGARIDARRVATQQMRPREMPRNARPWQRTAETEGFYHGNQIALLVSIDGPCVFPSDRRCDNRAVHGRALPKRHARL